jgi:predicted Zn-dependent protease
MANLFLKLVLLAGGFLVTWGLLRQLDWMNILNVQEVGDSTEQRLGKLYWDIFSKMEEEESRTEVTGPVDSLLTQLCTSNGISREKIKLHLIRKDDINAFALPDYHLVVFTGLIDDCENEAELAGVIAHELAHMEQGHIMKKLIKEIGLSMLISMTSGSGSPDVIREALRILSSTAYDRTLETEADISGVDYLIKAGINPEGLASFLFRMSSGEKDLPRQIFWITTHPGSEERSKAIIQYIEGRSYTTEFVLDSLEWEMMQLQVAEE